MEENTTPAKTRNITRMTREEYAAMLRTRMNLRVDFRTASFAKPYWGELSVGTYVVPVTGMVVELKTEQTQLAHRLRNL